MYKVGKVYSKHQKFLKYLLILYPNIQTKQIYILSLGILTYIIQIYTSSVSEKWHSLGISE